MVSATPAEESPTTTDGRGRNVHIRRLTIVAAGVLGGTLLLAHTGLPGPICLFRLFFHLPCPGCGLTRSLCSLWHANPVLSFRYHPLGIPIFLLCAVTLASAVIPGKQIAKVRAAALRPWSFASVAALLLGVWVVRLGFLLAGSRFFLW